MYYKDFICNFKKIMKSDRQQKILVALSRGKYMISVHDGAIYSRRYKNGGAYRMLSPTILKSGFIQYKIYDGKNGYLQIYAHHLVWLSIVGPFDQSDDIVHANRDRSNNGLENLFKRENFIGTPKEKTKSEIRTIRKPEIEKIKYMLDMGETNHSKIAKDLGLNRLSVRRTILKIKNNEKLKYE